MTEPLFTPKEAAAKLSMSVKTLMSHVHLGRIRFIDVGAGIGAAMRSDYAPWVRFALLTGLACSWRLGRGR
jgi:hypothetical protein